LAAEAEPGNLSRVTRSEQARMLRYRHQDGMTYAAIAAVLKRSTQTVHAYLSPLESTVDEARVWCE
jgi:DNA-directed RNA polymerase specialized sigma24 family protein